MSMNTENKWRKLLSRYKELYGKCLYAHLIVYKCTFSATVCQPKNGLGSASVANHQESMMIRSPLSSVKQ